MLVHPQFDPIALDLSKIGIPIAVHWYGITYLVGFGLFLFLAVRRTRLPQFASRGWSRRDVEDLLFYGVLGTVIGGRLGYVLFYKPDYYFAHPLETLQVWHGGMSFHGGALGVLCALILFCRQRSLSLLAFADIITAAVPIGIFFGRIANFVNGELWGRPTEMPWGVIFPGAGVVPRHPSELYEAGTEGLLLFLLLFYLVRFTDAREKPGLVTGIFLIGYACARIFCEFFREPDAFLGFLWFGATMGQLLSIPVLLLGAWIAWRAKPET